MGASGPINNSAAVRSAVQNAFDKKQYVEMSPAFGAKLQDVVGQASGVDCSPTRQADPRTPYTTRQAYVVDGELVTHSLRFGGMAHYVQNCWEDLGQAPIDLTGTDNATLAPTNDSSNPYPGLTELNDASGQAPVVTPTAP